MPGQERSRAMTAMTVPPPGWVPFGARELQSSTHSRLTRALVVSALGHLTLLALFLWVSARPPEELIPVYQTPVVLIPEPPSTAPVPPPCILTPPTGIPIGAGTIRPTQEPPTTTIRGDIVLPDVTGRPVNGRES